MSYSHFERNISDALDILQLPFEACREHRINVWYILCLGNQNGQEMPKLLITELSVELWGSVVITYTHTYKHTRMHARTYTHTHMTVRLQLNYRSIKKVISLRNISKVFFTFIVQLMACVLLYMSSQVSRHCISINYQTAFVYRYQIYSKENTTTHFKYNLKKTQKHTLTKYIPKKTQQHTYTPTS